MEQTGESAQERYEREKREDLAEWDDYLRTGRGIPYEEVDTWLRKLAEGKAAAPPRARTLRPAEGSSTDKS